MEILFFIVASLSAAAPPSAQPNCSLTEADKKDNAALSFDDFDQQGTLPSTSRALANLGCFEEAAEATEDYLLNGPARTDYEQRVIVWHMAQSLAMAGDERKAATLMAGTRVPTGNNENLDWNSYVKASWAFLAKNRAAFDAAAYELSKSILPPDRVNGAIVAAMGRCWTKPYNVAYDPDCGK